MSLTDTFCPPLIMVDSVRIWIDEGEIRGKDLMAEIPVNLENVDYHQRSNGMDSLRGNLKNMRVSVNERGVSISGSIPKFVYGHNLIVPNQNDISEALKECSDCLGIDVGKGKLMRLDIAGNIYTDYSPKIYYKYLGTTAYLERLEQKYGLRYESTKRSISIYDKVKECQKRKVPIPDLWKGKEIFRFEYRLMKKPSNYLKKEITPFDLCQPEVINLLISQWKTAYSRINKQAKIRMDFNKIKTGKDITKQLEALAIDQVFGGEEGFLKFIRELKERDCLNNDKAYQRARNRGRKVYRSMAKGFENDLIKELNQKFEAINIGNLGNPIE